MRHACDGGPIDLAGVAVAQHFRQGTRHAVGARQHQQTRGVFIQTVHQLGAFFVAKLQRFGQTVNMAIALPRAALAGQTRRLVQDDHMLILPQHRVLDHFGIRRRIADTLDHGGRMIGQRRNADGLARHDAVRGLAARGINPHLPSAAHLFHMALGQLRKAALEPFIKALLALGFRDSQKADSAHAKISRER